VAITSPAAGAEGNATMAAPGSPSNDDIWIAAVWAKADAGAHALSDWTEIVNAVGDTGRLSVWWFRYAGATPDLTVANTSGNVLSGIRSFRGCKTSGSPVNAFSAVAGGTDASIEHTAITPSVAGCALLAINGSNAANNRTALGGDYAVAFEDTSGGTQNCFQGTSSALCMFYDLSVPASDTGTVSITQSTSSSWGSTLVALEDASAVAGQPAVKRMGGVTFVGNRAPYRLWRNLLIPNRGLVYG
jgi:hypothetical protein